MKDTEKQKLCTKTTFLVVQPVLSFWLFVLFWGFILPFVCHLYSLYIYLYMCNKVQKGTSFLLLLMKGYLGLTAVLSGEMGGE